LADHVLRRDLGGVGLGTWLLHELSDPGADALASSHFAISGKLTGHDAIAIRGRCDHPSVLLINGQGARLIDASATVEVTHYR